MKHPTKNAIYTNVPVTEMNNLGYGVCRIDGMVCFVAGGVTGDVLDVRIIKAFRWRDDFSVEAANEYPADYILLDTFKKGMAGGTGEVFRWHEAAEETRNLNKPLLLAGGISAENAEEAARTLSPFALDVSGSLEENGEKSPEKIRDFMRTIDEIRNEAVQ